MSLKEVWFEEEDEDEEVELLLLPHRVAKYLFKEVI
jgi:hypothetical protein